MEISQSVAAAQAARARLDWRTAALAFTAAADNLPSDPHHAVTAEQIGLRRDAHLCLCRTEEFQAHRFRMQKRKPKPDTRAEWLEPSGALVAKLLGRASPKVLRREAACAAH